MVPDAVIPTTKSLFVISNFLLAINKFFSFRTILIEFSLTNVSIKGVIFFKNSFSFFFLSLQSLIKLNLKWLGPVTPIGGTLLIIGWIIFIINSIR